MAVYHLIHTHLTVGSNYLKNLTTPSAPKTATGNRFSEFNKFSRFSIVVSLFGF